MTAQFLFIFASSKIGGLAQWQVLITDDMTEFLKTKTLGFGRLIVGTKSSSDLGDSWHLFVLRERGQSTMLLYC